MGTAHIKFDPKVKEQSFIFDDFQGLDTSRDISAFDTGTMQHLAECHNAFCDWRGHVVRDPALLLRSSESRRDRPVTHVRYHDIDHICYWHRDAGHQNLWQYKKGSKPKQITNGFFDRDTEITSTTFNRKTIFFGRKGEIPLIYDGVGVERLTIQSVKDGFRPTFGVPIGRRLACVDVNGRYPTRVELSRVDHLVFSMDEDPNSNNVLRGAYIDIANLLGSGDHITGLGVFEQNQLVIFTEDKAIIYNVGSNLNNWSIASNSYVNIGCISHNTIRNAGTDLMFCSRNGIHSVRRSRENGLLVNSYSMSDKIDLKYRELFKSSQKNIRNIAAVYDQDMAQYHVFFPVSLKKTQRLTMSFNPQLTQSNENGMEKFSTGDFADSRCGDFLAGTLFYGASSGLYEVLDVEDENPNAITPYATNKNSLFVAW